MMDSSRAVMTLTSIAHRSRLAARCCVAATGQRSVPESFARAFSASIFRSIICEVKPCLSMAAKDIISLNRAWAAFDLSAYAVRTSACPSLAGSYPNIGSALEACFRTIYRVSRGLQSVGPERTELTVLEQLSFFKIRDRPVNGQEWLEGWSIRF